jgi:hypothetical protein
MAYTVRKWLSHEYATYLFTHRHLITLWYWYMVHPAHAWLLRTACSGIELNYEVL